MRPGRCIITLKLPQRTVPVSRLPVNHRLARECHCHTTSETSHGALRLPSTLRRYIIAPATA